MTAAHRLPGAILTPRCRGARAVARFTKTDATRERIAVQFEAATPNDDPAARLGDGILQPAFSAHLATRGCDKEARVAPAIRGANFNAAERHGATNQIQRIPVGQLSGSANAAHGFCLAVGSAALFNAPVAQWIEQRSSSAPCAGSSPAGGANFNAADARSRATLTCRVPTSDAEVISRSSARPAALFNGRNAQVDAPATAVPVLCSRHTREIDARPSAISGQGCGVELLQRARPRRSAMAAKPDCRRPDSCR